MTNPANPPQKGGGKPSGTTYEMLWDCEFCGTKGLLGLTHRFCPHCGAQQNPDKRYFPSDEEKVLVKDHVFYGEDVTCAACKTLNGANSDYCMNCGAPLSEGAKARTLGREAIAEGEKFKAGAARDLVKDRFEAEMNRVKGDSKSKGGMSSKNMLIIAGVVGLLIICAGICGVTLFWKNEQGVVVTGHSWERVIEIESFAARSDGNWCDSMPAGAYGVSRSQKERSTRQVPDGETCQTVRVDNGDGTYSEKRECTPKYRSEPVYDDYCSYTIDRWGPEREVKTNGNGLSPAPAWGEFTLKGSGNTLGAEREGSRHETYTVQFRSSEDNKTYDCDFNSEARWREFPIESRWSLEVAVVTGSADCDSLKRQ